MTVFSVAHGWKIWATLGIVLVLSSSISATPALASPTVTWGGTTTITEGDAASSINSSNISITGSSFDSGYLDFAIASQSASDVLSLEKVVSASTVSGEVSVVGSSVYLGNGTTADNIGSIDETRDGENGNSLRINFVNSFPNANFELDSGGSTSITGWTSYNQQVILGSTVIETFQTVDTGTYPNLCGGPGDDDDGVYTSWNAAADWQATVAGDQASSGTKSLRLALQASANSGGWFLRGPAVASSSFQASAGDTISFDWRSIASGDRYVAFGYLLNTATGAQTEILDEVGASGGLTTPWTTKTVTIAASGSYKFVFVAGAYNGDCGQQGSGSLYIDNVVVVGDKATAAVVTDLASLVRYRNTSDAPPASRTVTLTAEDGSGNSNTATTTISITAVNDPPGVNIDSAGVGVTKTETVAEARFSIPSVTGTLLANDPDQDSPTFTFGISGGSESGGISTKVGDYGTLSVDNSSDEYTYTPSLSQIESLNTGESATDTFTITVSDGQASGTGTLVFAINGFSDSVGSLDGEGTPAEGGVDLTWTAPSDDGVNTLTGYIIEARPKGSSSFSTVSDTDGNATNAAASIIGLDPCVAYDFRIKAVFDNGTGAPSTTTTVSAFGSTGLTSYTSNAFLVRGDATRSSGTITLTPDTTAKAGALWSGTRFDLRESFCVSAEVKLSDVVRTATGTAGADGIAFVLQPADTTSLSSGGGLGYSPSIDPSVAVEFDTYANGGEAQQEIAVRKVSGSSNAAWTAGTSGVDVTSYNIEDGEFHKTEIRYDGDQELLTVLFDFNRDGDFEDTGEVVFENIEESLNDFFSGTNFAYWGFTAATGGATNLQQVRNISFSPGSLAGNTTPTATNPGAQTVAVGSTSTVSVTLSDNSETTQDQWRLSVTSGNTAYATAAVSATSATNAEITVTGVANGDTTLTLTAVDADGASVTVSFAIRSGSGSPVVSSSGGTTTSPQPTIVAPPAIQRILPRLPVTPSVQQGPVLRGNAPPTPPSAPVATVGGRSTPIQTQVTSPTGFSLRTGVLNLGLEVEQDQGLVRQDSSGGTEIEVKKGSVAAVSGSGFLPRSTVQVFLPLQGTNAKEIARIPVDEAGSFSGDAVFATRINEKPLPIGKQVLQVVSLNEEGQQSVVEMTVNIAQSAPAPEPDRTVGAAPTLLPGQFLATNAGEPEVVTVTPVPEVRQARVEGDGWQMAVDIPSANGAVVESDEGGALLQLVRDETAVVSGSGFMAGTRADVWLFSEPTLLGTVDIDENGEFVGEVNIDANVVAVGEHTLQLQGVGEDGYVRAANLGVVVNDTAVEVSTEDAAGGFLWWLMALIAVIGVATALAIRQMRRRLR